MSPAFEGERGLAAVEIEAIVERLRSIDDRLERIEERRLNRVDDTMAGLEKRIVETEKWQAATDTMIESLNERVDEATDTGDKSKEWISEQKGWNSGRTQMIVQISMLIGMAVTLAKLLFFHS